MSVLVTGGAGYIGSFCCAALYAEGRPFAVIDNLSTGHAEAIEYAKLYRGDISDMALLREVFERESVDSVIHFAGSSLVGESGADPKKYFRNNVCGSLSLFECMAEFGVRHIVFSSSAAVYGDSDVMPLTEEAETRPVNTYGDSKLMIEMMLRRFDSAYGTKYAALRYFNVAGAAADGSRGEDHRPETHLVPNLLKSIEERSVFNLYGDDYPTRDGTCVRDYIQVEDLIAAHILALDYLKGGGDSAAFNIGSGAGFTVMEMIRAAETVTGREVRLNISERRPGDPAALVASSARAKAVLGWQPEISRVEDIIKTAYAWHKKNPKGY